MSEYIDLVVAQRENCRPVVFSFPAWTAIDSGDLIPGEGAFSGSFSKVKTKVTVLPDSEYYKAILAAANQEVPEYANTYYSCRKLILPGKEKENV